MGRMQLVGRRRFRTVEFGQVMVAVGAVTFGQLAHFKDAGRAPLEFGNPGHPIFHILRRHRLAVARAVASGQLLGRRTNGRDRPQQILGKVDAMDAHVAQFTGTGHRLVLPPADGKFTPILQALETRMANLTQFPAAHQMTDIIHPRHKAVGKGHHRPHTGGFGGLIKLHGLGVIHAQRLLTEDVAAIGKRFQNQFTVKLIRRGNHHRIRLHLMKKGLAIGVGQGHAPLILALLAQRILWLTNTSNLHFANPA